MNIDEQYLISERKRIGQLLKEARLAKGLTHELLAEQLQITVSTISKIENGKWNFGIDTITKFGVALGFNLSLAGYPD